MKVIKKKYDFPKHNFQIKNDYIILECKLFMLTEIDTYMYNTFTYLITVH